jgi:indolepyruvate ferredoxin oxidoreductase beta subunit
LEDPLNIIVTGVGGQGNIQASYIIASAALIEGFHVSVGETYGAAQRGGSVTSHIRLSRERQYGPLTQEGKVHVIVNPRPVYPIDVLAGEAIYPPINKVLNAIKELVFSVHVVEATELAKKVGDVIFQNVVMVGCLAASEFTPIKTEAFRTAITELFADKGLDINLKAFEIGVEEFKRTKPL